MEESCFGLAALTQIEEESPFSNEKLCGRLIRLLQRGSNVNLQKAALQLIGALTARSEEYTTRLLHFDLLSVLHELIEHKLGEDACWVISNIVADNIDHLNIVVKDPRIIPTIIRILKVDAAGFDEDEFAGRTRECCSILANIINKGQVDSIRHTVGLGGISALCTALKFCVETETLILLLDTLWKVVLFGESDRIVINDKPVNLYFELFKESGGYEGLARLAFRKDQQVADAAQQMAILVCVTLNPIITTLGLTTLSSTKLRTQHQEIMKMVNWMTQCPRTFPKRRHPRRRGGYVNIEDGCIDTLLMDSLVYHYFMSRLSSREHITSNGLELQKYFINWQNFEMKPNIRWYKITNCPRF